MIRTFCVYASNGQTIETILSFVKTMGSSRESPFSMSLIYRPFPHVLPFVSIANVRIWWSLWAIKASCFLIQPCSTPSRVPRLVATSRVSIISLLTFGHTNLPCHTQLPLSQLCQTQFHQSPFNVDCDACLAHSAQS